MSGRQIVEAVQIMAGPGKAAQVYALDAVVKSVDKTARTCVVYAISGKAQNEIPDVRLMAAVDDGVLIIPAVDSNVTIIVTPQSDAYITQYSEVEEIIFRGGDLGGLVRVLDAVDRYNLIEDKINSLLQKFNTHTHNVTAVGSPTGPNLQPETGTLQKTKRDDIENKKITQG